MTETSLLPKCRVNVKLPKQKTLIHKNILVLLFILLLTTFSVISVPFSASFLGKN